MYGVFDGFLVSIAIMSLFHSIVDWIYAIALFPVRAIAVILLVLTQFKKARAHPINDVTTTPDNPPKLMRGMFASGRRVPYRTASGLRH